MVGARVRTIDDADTRDANGPCWVWFFFAGVVGLATSVAFVYITQYYTAGSCRPVREIAEARRPAPRPTSSGAPRSASRRPWSPRSSSASRCRQHWLGSQANLRQRRGRQRRRHLRHRRGDDGHAHDHRLHPGDGHVRPDHRQRRRHRRVQPRRGRRARDHGPARRGRQHDQGPDQGLRDRLGVAGRVPPVLGLHRQGQQDPRQPVRASREAQLHAVDLADVNVFVAAFMGAMLVVLLQLARHPRGGQDGPVDHRRGAPPVPRDARDHGLHPAPRLRPRRGHHDPRGAARDGRAGRPGGGDPDRRRPPPRLPRPWPAS